MDCADNLAGTPESPIRNQSETDGPGDTVRGAGPGGRGAGLCGPGAPRLRDPGEDHADHEPAPPGARHSGSAAVPAAHAPGPRSGLRFCSGDKILRFLTGSLFEDS